MSIFKSDWEKFHLSFCDLYEEIGVQQWKLTPSTALKAADYKKRIQNVLVIMFEMDEEFATSLIDKLHEQFETFDTELSVEKFIRSRNTEISDIEISTIINKMKQIYHESFLVHESFSYFVISKLIETKNLSISRGEYLIKIASGKIPTHKKIIQFFRRWRQITNYRIASEVGQSNTI